MNTTFKSLMLAVLSVAFVVACGKKGSDGGGVQQVPPVQTCIMGQMQPAGFQCINGQLIVMPGGTGSLVNSAEFSTSYMSGQMSVSAMGGNVDLSNQQAIYFYSGQAQVTGTIQVLNNSLCGAPVGSYSVQGTGNIWAGTMSNMNLTISGPAMMNLMVYSAMIVNPMGVTRDGAGNHFAITGSQLTVNGVPCGPVVTY